MGVSHHYEFTEQEANPENPVLVFLHGWLLSHHYWTPMVEQLRDRYRCLTYDLRGFGDSQASASSGERTCDRAWDDYTLEAYAQDLVILLKELNIKNAWLVGHSLGGSIALWAADRLPQKIQGVICLNAGGGIYLKEEFERFRSAGQRIVKNRPTWLTYVPLLDWVFAYAMVAKPLSKAWGRQRLLDFIRADQQAALGSLLTSTTEEQVHLLPQIVTRLQQPVYFIAGAKDMVMEPKYVHHLASFHSLFHSATGNVIQIPNCGHLSMVEHPHQVADLMTDILQRPHPTAPIDPENLLDPYSR